MFRTFAILTVTLVVLAGAAIGYMTGTQTSDRDWTARDRVAVERTARAFYSALGETTGPEETERLASMLAPEFVERQIEVEQTLDRAEFLQAVVEERRTFPGQKLVPMQLESDGNWAVVTLQTVEAQPGLFVSIALPALPSIRREMIEVIDGRIVERIVLEGLGSNLRTLLAARIGFESVGMQTLSIVRTDFAPRALERVRFEGPAFVVVENGRLEIGERGSASVAIGPGDTHVIPAAATVEIENGSGAPAQLLALVLAPADAPQSAPTHLDNRDPGPGVTARRVAQSIPFLPDARCFSVHAGRAALAPGTRLPSHVASGFEIVIPTDGAIDAASEGLEFLRTDSARSWQDETGFARLESKISLAAPPGSRLSYTVAGDEPARFWIFAVEFDAGGCAAAPS